MDLDDKASVHLEVTAKVGRQGDWYLHLEPTWLRLIARDTDETVVVPRAEVAERVMLRGNALLVVLDRGRAVFDLGDDDHAREVVEWLGPPTSADLRVAQRRRMRWALPVGALILLTALPVAGDPGVKVAAAAFDLPAAVLGVSLIVLALVVRVYASRWLFVAEAAWFAGLTVFAVTRTLSTGSWWWILPVIAGLAGIWGAIQLFVYFAASSAPTSRTPAE